MGFSLCRLGHTPAGVTWGCLGVNFFFIFSKHGRVAYQIEGDDEQNDGTPSTTRLQVLSFSKMFQNSEIVVRLLI